MTLREPPARVCEIVAAAHGFPSEIVDNDQFFARCRFEIPGDRAALIAETRMQTRRWCAPSENTWTMARDALVRLKAEHPALCAEIDVVLVTSGTTLPVLLPPDPENPGMGDIAPLVLETLGRDDAVGFDLKSTYCSGFLRGLDVMDALLKSRPEYRAGLVLSTEQGSRMSVAETNRSALCFLASDAAGLVVLRARPYERGVGIVDTVGVTEASKRTWVGVGPDGYSMVNRGSRAAEAAFRLFSATAKQLLDRNGLTARDLAWFLPLQTHARLVDGLCAAIECPREKLIWFGDTLGMSGSGSVPSVFARERESGRIKKGDLVLSVAVGAGLNAAGALFHA